MTKEEILDDVNFSTNSNDSVSSRMEDIENVMDAWAEEVAIDYAHWLLERAFSVLMERPDREGRKLFNKYLKEKQL